MSTVADASARVTQVPAASVRRTRFLITLIITVAALFAIMTVDLATGEAEVQRIVTPRVVLITLARHLPGAGGLVRPGEAPYVDALVWDQRAPRVVGGALVGMLLAAAGVAFQSLLMNPLADPYTVGVSSGSALGAMAVALWSAGGALGGFLQPIAAFASGMAALLLVYFLARLGGRVSATSFLLAGIGVGMFFWSLIPLLLALSVRSGNVDRQAVLLSTLLGSLQGLDWARVGALAVCGAIGVIALLRSAAELDLMTLGEETAAHAGVDTEAFKRRAIVAGALLTAAAVSMAGIVAFVGLIVPHLARRIVGPKHEVALPLAMLFGALLLVSADWLSRVYLNQLQVGVVTSLLGAPVFCVLLRRRIAGHAG